MAMTLINPRATFGLQARFIPTETNVFGQVQIGANNETIQLPYSNVAYSFKALFGYDGGDFSFDQVNGIATASGTWVDGEAHVEGVDASGTCTTSGIITITITGSPINPAVAINVAIAEGDTPDEWAAKARSSLAANSTIAEVYDVIGETNQIYLSRKPKTIEVGGSNQLFYWPNDPFHSITIDAGTTGVDPATGSEIVSGTGTTGCLIIDGDGLNLEGNTIGAIDSIDGCLIKSVESVLDCSSTNFLAQVFYNGALLMTPFPSASPLAFSTTSRFSAVEVTIIATIA